MMQLDIHGEFTSRSSRSDLRIEDCMCNYLEEDSYFQAATRLGDLGTGQQFQAIMDTCGQFIIIIA